MVFLQDLLNLVDLIPHGHPSSAGIRRMDLATECQVLERYRQKEPYLMGHAGEQTLGSLQLPRVDRVS